MYSSMQKRKDNGSLTGLSHDLSLSHVLFPEPDILFSRNFDGRSTDSHYTMFNLTVIQHYIISTAFNIQTGIVSKHSNRGRKMNDVPVCDLQSKHSTQSKHGALHVADISSTSTIIGKFNRGRIKNKNV